MYIHVCSNYLCFHRGLVKRIRYMDTTENVRNLYLDRSDNHRSAGTRMLLEMVSDFSHTTCRTHSHLWTFVLQDVQLEGKGSHTAYPASLPPSPLHPPSLPPLCRGGDSHVRVRVPACWERHSVSHSQLPVEEKRGRAYCRVRYAQPSPLLPSP